ncbi:hypothetical protein Tco_0632804 [Tanacetum coccineum]
MKVFFMCDMAKDIWNSLIITHQGNKQVKDNKIDLFVQKYKEFIISDDETIDCAFARFNTIITSLKALDESFSSCNHVRKFLRALPTKWRPKVTAIEESKDLSTLPLDELIGNLKVYEVVLEKDLETSRNKKEMYKSLALKARKVLSEEEATSSDSNDEEYAMAIRDIQKFFTRRGKFVRKPHDDKRNFRKAKKDKKEKDDRRCFNDSEDDSKKEEICLMALDDNELTSKIVVFILTKSEMQKPPKDKHGIGYTDDIASTSNTKPKKLGPRNAEIPFVESTFLVPSAREPTSSNEQNWLSAAKMENAKNLGNKIVKKNESVLITRKSSFNISKSVKQPPILKLGQGLKE